MDDAVKKLTVARLHMLLSHPFYGQMAIRMKFVDATDSGWCKTAATDYKNFYYNRDFIAKLDKQELVFLFAHELYHCIFEHFIRIDKRDRSRWNEACDYVINLLLKTEGIGRVITAIPILLDNRFKGMTSEQVYNILDKEGNPAQETLDQHLVAGDGSGSGMSESTKGEAPTIDSDRMNELSDEIKQAVMASAAACGAGNVPAGIKRLIAELTESKMDWREHLSMVIETLVKNDYSWSRPSRKGWHMSAILPGMTNGQDQIEVSIAIDTSGSISTRMLQDFLGEIAGIMDQFSEYTVRIWQFDTKVYGYEKFTHDNGKDIREYEILGGGGTDFQCNWEFMKEKDIVPGQFLVFTDGRPMGSWGDPDYTDTMFMIHGSKTIKSPFGTTVYYDA